MEDGIMRKTVFCAATLVLVAAFMSMVACTRTVEADMSEASMTLLAKTETSVGSRTMVEGETHVYWEPGDEIKVFSEVGSGKFVSNLSAPSATADFTGTLGDGSWVEGMDLWAVYPYSYEAAFEDGTFITTLPSVQVARAGSFGKDMNLAVAHSTDNTLQFYNVGGGVRFSVTEEGVKKVVFEGRNGEELAGKIRIRFTDPGVPVVKQIVDGSKYITVLPPSGEDAFQKDTWYYIVAIPQSLIRGYKLRLYRDVDYATKISQKGVLIKKSIYGTIHGADVGINYESERTPFPQTAEEWEASESFTNGLLPSIHPLLIKCTDPAFEGEDVIEYFISQVQLIDGIVDAFPMDSNDGVVIVQRNGVHHNVILKFADEDKSEATTQGMLASRRVPQEWEYIIPDSGQKKAMFFFPYQTWKFSFAFPIKIDEDSVRYPLIQSGYGLKIYGGPDGTVDALAPNNLAKYDLLVLASHGSLAKTLNGKPEVCIMTSSTSLSEKFNPSTYPHLTSFLTHTDTNVIIRYGVGVNWLKEVEKQTGVPSFKNTIVMAMACYSYHYPDLADYFFDRGASFYCGNFGRALIKDMKVAVPDFVDYLCWGYTAQEAMIRVKQDLVTIPLITTQSEIPIYLVDPRPTGLTYSVNSSRVALQWNKPTVRWDYSVDLYIDGELVEEGLIGRECISRVYTTGWHSWYLETRIPYEDGESKPFRSSTDSFYIDFGEDVVDLGLSVKWAAWNVEGRCPEESGGRYAWGETETKSRYTWGTYKWCLDPDNPNSIHDDTNSLTKYCFNFGYDGFKDEKSRLEPQDDAAHRHMGDGYRMPTKGELEELINNCQIERTTLGGVTGYKFTSTVPGYTDKWIFICPSSTSSNPGIWSSDLDTSNSRNAWCLDISYITQISAKVRRRPRYEGMTIRAVCD